MTPNFSPDQIRLVKDMIAKKGISAEMWVRQICNQRGIDVEEFMKQFKDINLT